MIKPRFEAQDANFSGKQFILHCVIVQPGQTKYVYHARDDTTHNLFFVYQELTDIKGDAKNEAVIIKSDNAPTRHKNKYTFHSMQKLSDMCNIRIIRLHGAAGHGKGLIDTVSSFGVKYILCKNVIAFEKWFGNSGEKCSYLTQQYDDQMLYSLVDAESVSFSRHFKDGITINGCMMECLFVYKPNSKNVLILEYLCDCENYLLLEFQNCLKISKSKTNDNVEREENA